MPSEVYQPHYRVPDLAKAISKLDDLISGVHPACEAVTPISRRDFDNLVDSLKKRGLQFPIILDSQRRLLDGRSRILACRAAGVKLSTADILVTDADPWAIAESNIARRHLTVDQRAMAATKLLEQARVAAKKRQQDGAAQGRNNRNSPLVANSVTSQVKTKRRIAAVEEVSKESQVPRGKLTTAEKVKKTNPTLAAKVESGELPLAKAAKLAGVVTPAKRRKTNTRTEKVGGSHPIKTNSGDTVVFNDGVTSIVDRCDGVRVVRCDGATIYHHDLAAADVLVSVTSDVWWFGPVNSSGQGCVLTRDEAEMKSIDMIVSMSRATSHEICVAGD